MRRVAGEVLQIVDLDLPAIDAEAVLLEQAGHHVLRRRLLKTRRRDLHQVGQHLGLLVHHLNEALGRTTHALGQFWRVMSDLFLDLARAEAAGEVPGDA